MSEILQDSADSLSLVDVTEVDFSEKYWPTSDVLSLSDSVANGFLLFQFTKVELLSMQDRGKKLMYPMHKEVLTKIQNLNLEI